jgi:LysR family hydrogen peroxide-inducible transcriptional activator
MIVLPTTRQLKYFIALSETLSFSKAAEKSYITQSTLSASIKDLEDILGTTLFERHSRQVLLTEDGQYFLREATKLIHNLQDMVTGINKKSAPLSGTLRLGIIPTIAPFMTTQLLKMLKASYPELDLIIQEQQSQQLIDDLERGQIDLGLMAFPYPTAQFKTKIILKDELYLATKETKHDVTLDALSDLNLLLLEDGHCLTEHSLESCQLQKRENIYPNIKISTLEMLLSLIEEGYGEALIPSIATNHYREKHPKISFIPFKNESSKPQREIGLIWRKASIRGQDFELFSKLLEKIFDQISK